MESKAKKVRTVLTAAIIVAFFACLFILNLLLPKPETLRAERRLPAAFPDMSAENVLTGEFMERFNSYASDGFPFRDMFRAVSSVLSSRVFFLSDTGGLYTDDYGIGRFETVDMESAASLGSKISAAAGELGETNIYISLIPDKSIYSNEYLPGYDPALARSLLTTELEMSSYEIIDLVPALNAESYYKTDLHWNQPKLTGVLELLGTEMGFDVDLSGYTENNAGEFHGVYSGQLALPTEPDSCRYLSNPSLSAFYLNEATQKMEEKPVYDEAKFNGNDPYDIFLSGAQPLIILENPDADTEKELYLFRDSFSSSLAPLLAESYKKVCLIDLRYIDMRTVRQHVGFKPGSDTLFLYSTIVLNNAEMLRV